MEKIYHKLFKNTLSIALTVIISSLMIIGIVWATTTISTNISTGGTLDVTGLSTFSRATSTSATTTAYLYVGHDISEPTGWDFSGGDLIVAGDAYFNNKATTSVALVVGAPTPTYIDYTGGDLIVQGDTEIDANLYLAGRATSTSATTTAYLYVGPDITEDTNINFAGGDLVVADALNVAGVTYLDGALQATSTSLFTGAATFYSTVNVSGLTTLGAATSTSATTTAYLYVGYDITEPSGWDFSGGDLIVAGDAYFNNKATTSVALVVGAPTPTYIDYTGGDLIVQGDTEIDANLYLAGRATSTSATTTSYLYVGHDVTEPSGWDFSGGDLAVAGDAYFNNKATTSVALAVGAPTPAYIDYSGGDFIIQGDAEIDGNLYLAGRATSTSATTTVYLYVGHDVTEPSGWDFSDGDLIVAGDAYFNNKATTSVALVVGAPTPTYIDYAGGDLIVQGDVEIDGGLWVHSATTTDTLVVGSVASTTDYLIVGNSLGNDDDLIYFDIGRNEYFGWDDDPGEFVLTDDLNVTGNATTTGKTVFGATAPGDSATTTLTFGSYGTADTKGLCLKFFSGGVTVWCYFNTAALTGGGATSTALVCDSDSSCE